MGETADRPAFYALAPGGWRDYWTLLHPPYTAWHLSYVAMGAAIAPVLDAEWLPARNRRPLRTRLAAAVLWSTAAIGLAGGVALGIDAAVEVSPWMLAFVAV